MGKRPPSKLRAAYSDWHWLKLNPNSYAMDIDMLELIKQCGTYVPIAFTEIQRFGDVLNPRHIGAYNWLIKKTGLPVYVIETDESFTKFNVRHFGADSTMYSESDFIKFMDGLRGYKSMFNSKKINWDVINELKAAKIYNHTQQSLDILDGD